MRIWISAVCRSGSREAMRWPKALRQFIRASTRLRTWQPADRFHLARPGRRVSCRMSFRTRAAGQSSFHARPLQRRGMLAREPFSIAEELDPCAVHQQVERTGRTAVRYLHRDAFLSAAQGRKVRHRPVEASHRQNTLHHPGRLSERKPEQDLHHEAELNGRIAEDCRPTVTPGPGTAPRHLFVQPDQQRTTLLQRPVVGLPVGRAVAGGFRLGHPSSLNPWVQSVNPAR